MLVYNPNIPDIIQQLYPSLSLAEVEVWSNWVRRQPNYHIAQVGKAGCVVKYYDQEDPPWYRIGLEVAWWGHGRDAVRALKQGRLWAKLKGAHLFGYSLQGDLYTTRWRRL